MDAQCVDAAFARRLGHDLFAAQRRLHRAAIGPQPVRQQRRADIGALAGALALVECRHDGAIGPHRRGMVAHPRQRARRCGLLAGAHQVHQPGARPPRGRVKAGLVGLGAGFAIAGERGVDQALVERRQFLVGDGEAAAHRRRVVGDEHVGLGDEPAQHRLALRLAQIERQAALVAAVEHKAGVVGEPRPDRRLGAAAVGVAGPRRLDLDRPRRQNPTSPSPPPARR